MEHIILNKLSVMEWFKQDLMKTALGEGYSPDEISNARINDMAVEKSLSLIEYLKENK